MIERLKHDTVGIGLAHETDYRSRASFVVRLALGLGCLVLVSSALGAQPEGWPTELGADLGVGSCAIGVSLVWSDDEGSYLIYGYDGLGHAYSAHGWFNGVDGFSLSVSFPGGADCSAPFEDRESDWHYDGSSWVAVGDVSGAYVGLPDVGAVSSVRDPARELTVRSLLAVVTAVRDGQKQTNQFIMYVAGFLFFMVVSRGVRP